ncbi:AmmeMemoRadiSam system protein A [Desulfovirgula thermocuniculi]|uniref:AmmeMemoRadiSam system protein A n=1 Tax=Desulfovirgula thermocuniculi TaxID=348842 RepID=UPI0003F85A71|nr:AmmeMemoRadiSam system protein A [Desulfovirgula thermocuniculi]
MAVVAGGVCPHPPVMVPEVGGRDAEVVVSSQKAMLELGRRLRDSGAQVVALISPHGPVFRDAVAVWALERLAGDLAPFGARQVRFEVENDLALARAVQEEAAALEVNVVLLDKKTARSYGLTPDLDHGTVVPLYFLRRAGVDWPLLPVGMSFLPRPKLYAFGAALARAAARLGRKLAVLASGDLSHRLTPDAPAGFDPRGAEFDREIVRLVGAADAEGVLGIEETLASRAGECGLRSIIMALGAFDGLSVKAEVLSYEGPFGVGYLVAHLAPGGEDPARRLLERLAERAQQARRARREREGFLVRVARRALENYFAGKEEREEEKEIPPEFARRAGVFVSLHKEGQLRGCIGTVTPQHKNIVEEVAANALAAALRDPRFPPVTADELADLEIKVDVLSPPEPVQGPQDLDPKKYGVIVKSGGRQGLLLPDIEGVDTVEEQLEIARKKAGIGPGEPVQLYRFTVERHT